MPAQYQCLDPTRLAASLLACTLLIAPARAEEAAEEEPPQPVGFELGAFIIKSYEPLEDVTTRLIFTAHASVPEDRAEGFSALLKSHRNRVRDQVLTAARLAQQDELQDPKLELLRRRILLRLRHSLPELEIDEIFLSDFQLYRD